MKAFLLAAGCGTRLKPLTDRLPKCLVEIGGKPLLLRWLQELAAAGVTDVLVNTHHLADEVETFLAQHTVVGLNVRTFHEPELLGSAGTVTANADFVKGEQAFLVIYADNYTDIDISDLLEYHTAKNSEFTMGLFRSPTPRECGIAVLDDDDRVVDFVEKPSSPESPWANAGIYVADTASLLARIPQTKPCDFGYDVLPLYMGEAYGYRIEGVFCDIGTPERLAAARRLAERHFGVRRLDATFENSDNGEAVC
ncbi:MAG: nucleotidyltransferase family protein [Kiritimatiellae bacterium]|nr:nucleotidyltransferase family protein [Kiritimatiellia bacterium]